MLRSDNELSQCCVNAANNAEKKHVVSSACPFEGHWNYECLYQLVENIHFPFIMLS